MSKKLLGIAKLNKLGNDLYWDYYYFDESNTWHSLKWRGYNDAYWWNEVMPKIKDNLKIDNKKKYLIDYETLEVFEVVGEENE